MSNQAANGVPSPSRSNGKGGRRRDGAVERSRAEEVVYGLIRPYSSSFLVPDPKTKYVQDPKEKCFMDSSENEAGKNLAVKPGNWNRGQRLRRVLLYGALVVGGSLLILIGPHTFFYFEFQSKLTALAESADLGVLNARATSSAPRSQGGWVQREVDGVRMISPVGELEEARPHGETGHLLSFANGQLRIDRFAPGSLAQIYRYEHEKAGGVGAVSANDVEVLRLSTGTALDEYRFLWSAAERGDYTARLLTKMLLFEPGSVSRFEFCEDTQEQTAAILLEYTDGAVKGFVVSPEQVWKLHLTATTPREWTVSPENWLAAFPTE